MLWGLYLKSYLPAIIYCPDIYILLLMCINMRTVEADGSEVVFTVAALCMENSQIDLNRLGEIGLWNS